MDTDLHMADTLRPQPGTQARGFTLIELMIAVAIVAILASVALPAYTAYIRRGQMQEAFSALSDYGLKLEQYYLDNKNYGATGATTCATAATANSWNGFAPNGARYFTFSCALTSNTNNQGFTLTATGSGGAVNGAYIYTLDSAGNKATTKFAGSTVTLSCWASKGPNCD
ncbi:type IV pilin protein [Aquabacterium sp.]|uniref:type IV pilin protein n=1 Tax=Aquabacterium sp. TaxID=1872578 RepID=UPI0025C3CC26|nr:type IV pilin protein [Aquabacterium sp.]